MVAASVRKLKVRGVTTGAMSEDAVCARRHPITANDLCVSRLCVVGLKARLNLSEVL